MANQLISLPPKLLRSQPSTHRVHPSTEQPAASNQASTQGKHADHPETCFLFTILRRLKHRKRQRALRACRTDCRNRANNTDAAPKNDELAALGGRKPKEIKYLYNRRGRRRSTAQLSVAGVEALPNSAWQASKHCPGAASHVSRSSLLLRGVRAAPPRIILPPRLLPRRVPRLPLLGLEPRHLSF